MFWWGILRKSSIRTTCDPPLQVVKHLNQRRWWLYKVWAPSKITIFGEVQIYTVLTHRSHFGSRGVTGRSTGGLLPPSLPSEEITLYLAAGQRVFRHQYWNLLVWFFTFPPFPLLLSRCSAQCCLPYLEPSPCGAWPLWPQTGQGCQRYSHTPFPHLVFVSFFLSPCFLVSCSVSVAVPDLSDRRLVRVVSAAPTLTPQSPCLVWSLERSSGLSDRRLVRIVRLPPLNKQQLSNRWGLKTACVRFFWPQTGQDLRRLHTYCNIIQKWTRRLWPLTGQGSGLHHGLDGVTYSTASCTILGWGRPYGTVWWTSPCLGTL